MGTEIRASHPQYSSDVTGDEKVMLDFCPSQSTALLSFSKLSLVVRVSPAYRPIFALILI